MINLNSKEDHSDIASSMSPESPIKYAVLPKNLSQTESNASLNITGKLGGSA